VFDEDTRAARRVPCDYFVSTMPVKDLIAMLRPDDRHIAQIAADLPYRSFITAGLLLRSVRGRPSPSDNWIYIQEPDVRIGRLQIFNNWSPAPVADPATIWLGWDTSAAKAMTSGPWTITGSSTMQLLSLRKLD
jgi:protoporphyrinogen oxidase